MRALLKLVTYKQWAFEVWEDDGRPYLQVTFEALDLGNSGAYRARGRKWLLSPHMTKSEIVSTALKAVLTAEEHEARESFRYKGKMVFGPHLDVDVLAEVAGKKESLDIRP